MFGSGSPALADIRLVVSDMDGTLVNNEGNIYATTVEHIRNLSKQGIEFMIATGRTHQSVLDIYELIGINAPVISLDGALLKTEGNDSLYYSHGFNDAERTALASLSDAYSLQFTSVTPRGINHYQTQYIPGYLSDERTPRREVDKQTMFHDEPLRMYAIGSRATIESYTEKLKSSALHKSIAIHAFESRRESGIWYAELKSAQASKGNALKWYMRTKNVQAQQVAVIGDYRNDLSLFELGAYNVALANAVAELRQKAHHITKHNAEDGGVDEFLSAVLQAKK